MNKVEAKTLVSMLAENAEYLPNKIAMIYYDRRTTYRMLYDECNALANFLCNSGLKPGDNVGYILNKTPEVIISFLGVVCAGGVVFPVDFNQPLHQIQHLIDLTRPRVMIVAEEYRHLLSSLSLPSAYLCAIVVGDPVSAEDYNWNQVIQNNDKRPPGISVGLDDTAYFNLTSGTTGLPKCAVTTHANIFWNTAAAVESLGLTPDDVHLCLFAVFVHPHELFARPLYLGGTFVLLDRIAPKTICRTITEYGVTCIMAIASIYRMLVQLHDASAFELPSLKYPESGGMHTPSILLKEFEEHFHRRIIPVWGSTEATGIALAMLPDREYKPGSVGKLCPFYEARIVDDNGVDLDDDQVGELLIRGPGVISYYFGNVDETDKSFKNGWLCTGDMFKKDSSGYFFFSGRRQGMLKVGGLKVYPVEIEEALLSHPGVLEAVVVKGHDNLHGEIPKAIIVPKVDVVLNKRDIRQYCEKKLSKHKVPKIIGFRQELPKTSGGKILWKELC
jgi:long-chain acyl-CoA synthetase